MVREKSKIPFSNKKRGRPKVKVPSDSREGTFYQSKLFYHILASPDTVVTGINSLDRRFVPIFTQKRIAQMFIDQLPSAEYLIQQVHPETLVSFCVERKLDIEINPIMSGGQLLKSTIQIKIYEQIENIILYYTEFLKIL